MAALDLAHIRARYASLDDASLLEDIDRGPTAYSSPDVWAIIVAEADRRGVSAATRIAPQPPVSDLIARAISTLPPSARILEGPFAKSAWFLDTGLLKLEILKRGQGKVTAGTIDNIGGILGSSLELELRPLRPTFQQSWFERGLLVLQPSTPVTGPVGSPALTPLAAYRLVFASVDVTEITVTKDAASSFTSNTVRRGLVGGLLPSLVGNAVANAAEIDIAHVQLTLKDGFAVHIAIGGASARYIRGVAP